MRIDDVQNTLFNIVDTKNIKSFKLKDKKVSEKKDEDCVEEDIDEEMFFEDQKGERKRWVSGEDKQVIKFSKKLVEIESRKRKKEEQQTTYNDKKIKESENLFSFVSSTDAVSGESSEAESDNESSCEEEFLFARKEMSSKGKERKKKSEEVKKALEKVVETVERSGVSSGMAAQILNDIQAGVIT